MDEKRQFLLFLSMFDLSYQKCKQIVDKMSDDAIIYQYNKLQETLLTNNAVDEKLEGQPTRVSIVNNIKGTATKLLGLVNKGKKTKVDGKEVIVHVVWNLLPQDVRDMFQEEEVTIRGVKQKVKTLKPEVYSVGRGAVKGKRVFGKEQDLTHDTTKIINNYCDNISTVLFSGGLLSAPTAHWVKCGYL